MSLKYNAAATDKYGKKYFVNVVANNKNEALEKAWAKFYELGIKPSIVKIYS